MYDIKDFEIMAPVGSRESLAAALQAGADSIYFGIESLNMRARSASTFTIDDLREIARICDEHGVKSYLTINTIIYDEDIALMRQIVDAAHEAGISAVIAADVAVMAYCNEVGQEVHLSTQLNISNAEALKFYARFADVAVLARELNLTQVRAIYDTIQREDIRGPKGAPVRIEMFCHGALCMAVSGKCYLSLHEHNRSANRGACMQVCRRAYEVRDKDSDIELEIDNKYIMSPKDLKTIRFMDQMIEAGVRVFKIEGRARGPEYVRTVVECYKEAIRAYLDGSLTEEKKDAWDERLRTVFNRGFWNGYYLGQRLGEWSKNYGSEATERKQYVGKGIKYFSNISVAEFLVEAAEINVGDKLLVTGPTTGAMYLTLDEARVDLKPVDTVKKGVHVSFKVPGRIRPSDKLYKMVSALTLLFALFLFTACKHAPQAAPSAAPLLTVTIEPQRYFVEAVAGPRFKVVSMVPKGSSPETYDPTPQQLVNLGGSRAYLRIGYIGFEVAWFDKLCQSAPQMDQFNLSAGIRPIYERHADDEAHPVGIEPHIWMSAGNARVITDNVCATLSALDAAHAAEFTQRADSLKQVIARTDSTVRSLLPEAGAFLIYHPSLSYFARDYGWQQIAIEEGGKEPSPAQLKTLIEQCRTARPKVIFVQPEFDVRNARTLAEELDVKIVSVNPLSYDWADEMIRVAQALHDAAL
jgi:putative protease